MKELFEKVYIRSEADLPKEGLYFCAITDSCYGSFHFNPDDKDDIDFWVGNVMWHLQPIEPLPAPVTDECEHPYAFVYRKSDYERCDKCGKILCEG